MKQLKALAETPIIGGLVKKAMSTMASHDASAISEHFSKYLQPQIADSAELRSAVYRLRHQVYCEELKFEDVRAGYEENDDFDSRSIHCFIKHLSTGKLAGTVRLITSRNDEELLPIEKFCMHSITHKDIHPNNFRREEICEISRLAVPADFRKRAVDKYAGVATGVINEATFSANELRCFPYIAICLYLSTIAMSYHTKRFHGFVMMEPRLARSLSFVGINFIQLGEPVDYHGLRAPYYIDGRVLRQTLSAGYLDLLTSIEQSLFKNRTDPSADADLFGPAAGFVPALASS